MEQERKPIGRPRKDAERRSGATVSMRASRIEAMDWLVRETASVNGRGDLIEQWIDAEMNKRRGASWVDEFAGVAA
jgi:hypothetical protein